MADDFLPVGIKAKVVGVDKFLGDLRRMQAEVVKLGEVVKDAGVDVRTLGAITRTTSESNKLFAASAQQMSQSSKAMGFSATQLSKVLSQLTQKMNSLGPAAARANKGLTDTKTTVTSSQSAIQRLADRVTYAAGKFITSTNAYKTASAELRNLQDQYSRLKTVVDSVSNELKDNNAAVNKTEQEWSQANQEFQRYRRRIVQDGQSNKRNDTGYRSLDWCRQQVKGGCSWLGQQAKLAEAKAKRASKDNDCGRTAGGGAVG